MSRGECPFPDPECKYADIGGCFSDVHHLYYPAGQYKTKVEKEFRELPTHKTQICRQSHDERHATETPPTKPSRDEMLRAIASYSLWVEQGGGLDLT